jgi:hypothetical protein
MQERSAAKCGALPQIAASSVTDGYRDVLHHLGIEAAADQLPVQHPPDSLKLVDAASLSYSGVRI